jgi:DNA-binding MarR family transcriptional regulator
MAAFDIGKLDDVIHGRVRLGVMAYLAQAGVAEFTELKNLLEVTQGNLSVHLRKLEEAGYIAIEKSFFDRKPLTRARLTPAGRQAFGQYLEAIGRLVGDQNG